MEIYQRPQSLLIFLLVILLGCASNNEKTPNEKLEDELIEVSKNAKRQQELLEKWFKDFQKVQEEIFSINTNELLFLEYELEGAKKQKTDREKIIEKIKQIKLLLKQKDEKLKRLSEQLQSGNQDFTYLEKMVYSLKKDIKLKKNKIGNLEQKYYTSVRINDSLSSVIQTNTAKIDYLLNENGKLKDKINEKYAFLIAAKEVEMIPIKQNSFNLNFKINDLKVLTNHPGSSYNLIKRGKTTMFQILNESQFWNGSNYLVIRIKKRKLY